jgi:ADP-ribose pyrophosphatase YjhB (NUDIX family)
MKHRIRVCGIARSGDRLALIEQHNPDTGHKRWTLPGGGVEITDDDIFRAVEREMFEETGLHVQAGAVRFISEHFASVDNAIMLTLWIDCTPVEAEHGPLTLDNIMHDDNITDVRWWSQEEILAAEADRMSRHVQKDIFWQGLDALVGVVDYLGRSSN